MTLHASDGRPRSRRSGAFCFRLLLAGAALAAAGPAAVRPAAAQVPDSVRARPPRADTAGGKQAADTTPPPPPPPSLVHLPPARPPGWADGVWEWNRDELRLFPDLTLLQLLERVPGLTPVRPLLIAQPEGLTVFGASLGAVRYIVDGYELDPLLAPTFDPSTLPLLALANVRVERDLTGATVRIRTLSPSEPGPESIIEAGTGDLGINLFRGVFMAPRVVGGPLAAGFERLAADPGAPSNLTTGWLKWSWARDSTGVQVEYRQEGVNRSGVGLPEKSTRRDWALRARRPFGPLAVEAYVGASSVQDDQPDVTLRDATTQAGLRVAGRLPIRTRGMAAFRWRSYPRLPQEELDLSLWSTPLPRVAVGAELTQQWWQHGVDVGSWSARAELGPLLGLTAFASVFRGNPLLDPEGASLRVVPAPDSILPIELSRNGVRAGLQFSARGLFLGAAAILLSSDSAAGYGLPFDPDANRYPAGEANGFEAMAVIPTGFEPLHLEGWYVGVDAPSTWVFLPDHHWRAALVYHQLPLPSGHLELYGRLEHVYRGRMPVAAPAGLVEVGAYRATNLEISIRVLTVTAFLRWDNFLDSLHPGIQRDFPPPEGEDIRVFSLPGQHVAYGVKWTFTN